jgi:phosphoglycolate phosphatase
MVAGILRNEERGTRNEERTTPTSFLIPHSSFLVEAVLFDLDGTLVDSHIDFGRMRREMLELAAESGCELTALASADILQIRDAFCARAADAGGALRRAEARLVQIEREAMERSTPVEGAGTLLTALRGRGVRVGIVTRNCREIAVDSLRRHGLPYDILIAREDTPQVKPHPEHLLRALAALAVPPERAVMVGDGRMDIEAGLAGGLRTVGYLAPDRPADYFARLAPDQVIRRLAELIPWIYPSSS